MNSSGPNWLMVPADVVTVVASTLCAKAGLEAMNEPSAPVSRKTASDLLILFFMSYKVIGALFSGYRVFNPIFLHEWRPESIEDSIP
jgi:hypothetical protein